MRHQHGFVRVRNDHFICTVCGKETDRNKHQRNKDNKIKIVISIIIAVGFVGFFYGNDIIEYAQAETNSIITNLEQEQKIVDEKYIQDITINIHKLINDERTIRGLSILSFDPTISKAALNHSEDMAKRNYFEHDSPEGYDFTYRYGIVGFDCNIPIDARTYSVGGENIMYFEGWSGVNSISSETVQSWMNSPYHKENILTPYFNSQGIGVYELGSEIYITQNFC